MAGLKPQPIGMSYILDKYNFGHSNYALLETVLEVGTQVQFLLADCRKTPAVVEEVKDEMGSAGFNLILITAASIFERASSNLGEDVWATGNWMIAIDEFATELVNFLFEKPDIFKAPNTGDDDAQKEFEAAVLIMAMKQIKEFGVIEEEN